MLTVRLILSVMTKRISNHYKVSLIDYEPEKIVLKMKLMMPQSINYQIKSQTASSL